MITLTFPDGSARQFKPGLTGAELAASISKSLSKKAVAISLNGALADMADPITADARVKIVTRDDAGGAGADPPRRRPCDGRGRAGALSRHAGHHRPRRSKTASITISTARRASRPTIWRRSRRSMREIVAARQALHEGSVGARQGAGFLRRRGRRLQGGAYRRHPRGRGSQDL